MTTNQKIGLGVVLALVAFTAAFIGGKVAGGGISFGGSINRYEAGVWQFGNGLYAGLTQQFSVDSNGALTTATTTNSTYYWTIGGIDYASVQQSFTSATTTPCSI